MTMSVIARSRGSDMKPKMAAPAREDAENVSDVKRSTRRARVSAVAKSVSVTWSACCMLVLVYEIALWGWMHAASTC